MAWREKEIVKKYWDIGEVAHMFKVYTSNIRYLENEGMLGKIKRSTSGNRKYTRENIDTINKILTCRDFGIPVDRIKSAVYLGYLDYMSEVVGNLCELQNGATIKSATDGK